MEKKFTKQFELLTQALEMMLWFVHVTNCSKVISSQWRLTLGKEQLRFLLEILSKSQRIDVVNRQLTDMAEGIRILIWTKKLSYSRMCLIFNDRHGKFSRRLSVTSWIRQWPWNINITETASYSTNLNYGRKDGFAKWVHHWKNGVKNKRVLWINY